MTMIRSRSKSSSGGAPNFDYYHIKETESVTIPQGQESHVWDYVDNEGNLTVEGHLYIFEDSRSESDPLLINAGPSALGSVSTDNFSYIKSHNVTIPDGQEMAVSNVLNISDKLTVRGTASIRNKDDTLGYSAYRVNRGIEIPNHREMNVKDKIEIKENLKVVGKLNINSVVDEPFSYSKTVRPMFIPADREMHVYGRFTANKDLTLQGKLRVA